jgi:predicted nuclease with TOPRIM domain
MGSEHKTWLAGELPRLEAALKRRSAEIKRLKKEIHQLRDSFERCYKMDADELRATFEGVRPGDIANIVKAAEAWHRDIIDGNDVLASASFDALRETVRALNARGRE